MLVRYVGWGGIAVIVGVVFVCLCWCASCMGIITP